MSWTDLGVGILEEFVDAQQHALAPVRRDSAADQRRDDHDDLEINGHLFVLGYVDEQT